jgi:hypothetical protein
VFEKIPVCAGKGELCPNIGVDMDNEKKEWIEYITEIQQALKPLNYEIVGFDTPLNEPIVLKIIPIRVPLR